MRRITFLTALCAVVLTSLAAVADGPVTGNIEALKVVVADGGKETLVSADQAQPSDVIEYRLTYANKGEAPIRNITITDPIPTGTEYIQKTATRPQAGAVEFSIDGAKTFHAWPIKIKKTDKNGNEKWVDATPDMVSHIRWTISDEFEPASEITFSYRAVVK